jgi:hypothetical protein
MSDEHAEWPEPDEVEVVEGLPVLAEYHTVEVTPAGAVPTVQAAALAAGGFFAGALTMALLKRVAARKLAGASKLPDTAGSLAGLPRSWPAGGSRTYVVTVRPVIRPE